MKISDITTMQLYYINSIINQLKAVTDQCKAISGIDNNTTIDQLLACDQLEQIYHNFNNDIDSSINTLFTCTGDSYYTSIKDPDYEISIYQNFDGYNEISLSNSETDFDQDFDSLNDAVIYCIENNIVGNVNDVDPAERDADQAERDEYIGVSSDINDYIKQTSTDPADPVYTDSDNVIHINF